MATRNDIDRAVTTRNMCGIIAGVLTAVTIIIYLLGCMASAIDGSDDEVNRQGYLTIKEMVQRDPALRPMVAKALSDNRLTKGEFNEINRVEDAKAIDWERQDTLKTLNGNAN